MKYEPLTPRMTWDELTSEQQEHVRTMPAFQHRDGTGPTVQELRRMTYQVMRPIVSEYGRKLGLSDEPFLSCRDSYALADVFPAVKAIYDA